MLANPKPQALQDATGAVDMSGDASTFKSSSGLFDLSFIFMEYSGLVSGQRQGIVRNIANIS